jgi:hypothetical protein
VYSGTIIALEDGCHDKIMEYSNEKQVIIGGIYGCFLRKQLFFREEVIVLELEVVVSEGRCGCF